MTKKTLRQSDADANQRLLETALKAAGLPSFKGTDLLHASDEQKIKALELHIETMKQHRWELSQEHGKDANKAVSRLNSEISRAIELIATLKIAATEPD